METEKKLRVKLVGEDGNAFAIIGRVSNALKRHGRKDEASAYCRECLAAKSYAELLEITTRYVDVS